MAASHPTFPAFLESAIHSIFCGQRIHQLAEETNDPNLPLQLEAYLSNLPAAITPPLEGEQKELRR